VNIATQGEGPGEEVVADYLANRLGEAEAQAFELYCLGHPDFARHVERELALKTGLHQVDQPVIQVNVPRRDRRDRRWPLAIAASVVVVVSAVLIIRYSVDRQPRLAAFPSVVDLPAQLRRAAVSEVRLVRMRGNETATRVSVPAGGVVDIRVIPGVIAASGAYAIRISGESPSTTKPLIVRGLRPAPGGYLQLYVPAAQMIGQTWVISVGDDADFAKSQSAEVFRLGVAAPPEAIR
jgi:hypothetical protein